MAAITIKTNLASFVIQMKGKIDVLKNRELLLRPVAFGVIDLIQKRIHIDGKASDGNAIGQYSNGYVNGLRKKNNRGPSKKIIISLTRQMENNYAVIATPKGYGIGFLNSFDYDKTKYVEATYGKPIFSLTQSEREYAIEYINDLVNEAIK